MVDNTNNATPQEQAQLDAAYAAKVAYETNWPAQQAAQAQSQSAAEAAKIDADLKARIAWTPAKNPYLKKKGK